MDASEKIIRFDSYEALLEEIQRDMNNGDPICCRYPVRFIMLNNFNVWHQLAQDLACLGVQPLDLEELIKDSHERWITTDELSRTIKACTVTSVVTPFSELVRFYSDTNFRGFFNEIMLTEDIDRPQKRIYIPLIGLQNRFNNFLNGFARIEESAPVWAYLTEEHKTKVFLTTIKNETDAFAGHENIKCLNTLYDWLRFWKTHAPQEQIICSSGPINRKEKFSDPDNIFTFEYIKNSYEYIVSFLGVSIPFIYNETEEKYWSLLLADIIKSDPAVFNLSTFISNHLGALLVSTRDLFYRWGQADTTPYDRWLLKNYFLTSASSEEFPYLKICVEELSAYDDYCELHAKVAERIFYVYDSTTQKKYAKEREILIKDSAIIFNEFINEATKDYLKTCISEIAQNDVQLAITLTTGVFDFEKVLLLAWYADSDQTGLKLEDAAKKYPDLGMYLSNLKPSEKKKDNWHLDYLEAYRDAKLHNVITESVASYIKTKNHNSDSFYGWYYSFNETHDLLHKHAGVTDMRPDKIYWIDALGAEFMPYLLSFFKEKGCGYRVAYSEITRCTIPSATAQNRFDAVSKFSELDAIAHDSKGYKKNISLVKELRELFSILRKIVDSNTHGEHTIAIVSDHGLSCLSCLAESKKYDAKVEHDGRYIKVNTNGKIYEDADYIVHVNENDGERYKVALTHSSLGRKPVHEVHGGCTPEEVLVPYIIITNKAQNLINYKYELITKEVEVSEPVITIAVMPQPASVTLHIGNNKYSMNRNGRMWSAQVDGVKEGVYKAEFTIPGGTSFTVEVQVNGTGFGGNDFLDF